jgi:hypothetical protein
VTWRGTTGFITAQLWAIRAARRAEGGRSGNVHNDGRFRPHPCEAGTVRDSSRNRPGTGGAWGPGIDGPDLESLPFYVVEDRSDPRRLGPGAVGVTFGSHDAAATGTSTWTFERAPRFTMPTWLDIDRRPPLLGTDYTVRRIVEMSLAEAIGALGDVYCDLLAGRATHRGPTALVRTGAAVLAFAIDSGPVDEVWRIPGLLHVYRFRPPSSVELVVEVWSRSRTELRLQIRGHRSRVRYPRRYFDVAHPVMSALRDRIEAQALKTPANRTGPRRDRRPRTV